MRWRLPAGVIALLPLIAVTAQQQQHPSRQSHHHHHQPSQQQVLLGGLQNPSAQHFRDTLIESSHSNIIASSDASAIATLAPARGSKAVPAVGAPPARRTSPESVIHSQLNARSLQDWEVEDFVLLATVDGSLYARERKTGAPIWALEVPTPMVETIYHRENTTHNSFYSNSKLEDDLLWIVEPSRDGQLYVYHQAPDRGLQKLGLTVKALVDNTPYSSIDPPVTYTARKETTLYTVDTRTGAVLRVFSSQGSQAKNQCRNINSPAPTLDDEYDCEPQIGGTITIGHVEYIVSVQNTETGDPICTIKYAEWTPNSRDADLENQYTITMDKRHIYSMHDGIALGFDHGKMDGRRFVQRFSSPVARVFDVARQVSSATADDTTPLVLLSQPIMPPDPDYASTDMDDMLVFINCTEQGGWFAMSESTYPLVTGRGNQAQIYTKDYTTKGKPLLSLSFPQLKAALVGVHKLNNHDMAPEYSFSPPVAGLLTEATRNKPREEIREQSNYSDIFETSAILRTTYNNRGDVIIVLFILLC
ncbi:bifunctional endoribonuclease/protein kinase ire1, partial [Ascosphaera pollenicola]